jgi:hypothetical protein
MIVKGAFMDLLTVQRPANKWQRFRQNWLPAWWLRKYPVKLVVDSTITEFFHKSYRLGFEVEDTEWVFPLEVGPDLWYWRQGELNGVPTWQIVNKDGAVQAEGMTQASCLAQLNLLPGA